jgi:hypothetical protein
MPTIRQRKGAISASGNAIMKMLIGNYIRGKSSTSLGYQPIVYLVITWNGKLVPCHIYLHIGW